MTTQTNYKFINKEYSIKGSVLSLDTLLSTFIKDNQFKKDDKISILFQVKDVNNSYFAVGNRVAINPTDSKDVFDYCNYLSVKYSVLDARYKNVSLLTAFFNYSFINEEDYTRLQEIEKSNKVDVFSQNQLISPSNLPSDTSYSTWGTILEALDSKTSRIKNLYFDINSYIEYTELSPNNFRLKVFSNGSNQFIHEFTDLIVNKREFVRTTGKKSYYFKDNNVYFYYEGVTSNAHISKLTKNKKHSMNFMTLDLETYLDSNNQMVPYCCSIYDGKTSRSNYLSNYTSVDKMLESLFKDLFTRKYNGKLIYIHNSSNFDLVFLLKHLVVFPGVKVNPIVKDGKFINLDISFGPLESNGSLLVPKYKVSLRDSLLLLPSSLDKLAKQFKVTNLKDIFPYSFVIKDNLNYIGPVPGYEYFDSNKVSVTDYSEYCARFDNKDWNLRIETMRYCEQDCKSLYQVLRNFSEQIFKDFKINVSLSPTLPSLAFRIFRTHFMKAKDIRIPILSDSVYKDLEQAYYGGHVDMYIPESPEESKVFGYDVNSLYPAAMKQFKFPTNLFAYFIAKLLMNSLYGRFGMKPSLFLHKVIDSNSLSDLINRINYFFLSSFPFIYGLISKRPGIYSSPFVLFAGNKRG